MNTKHKAVDVLAVLHWASVSADSAKDSREADEARAAVAALIEAAEEIEYFGVRPDRLAAAIARCKGE